MTDNAENFNGDVKIPDDLASMTLAQLEAHEGRAIIGVRSTYGQAQSFWEEELRLIAQAKAALAAKATS